jgi:hypothetical protein
MSITSESVPFFPPVFIKVNCTEITCMIRPNYICLCPLSAAGVSVFSLGAPTISYPFLHSVFLLYPVFFSNFNVKRFIIVMSLFS